MKTIATAAAAIMIMSATAWADEQESKSTTANEPIVLSEAEMDEVTAGAVYTVWWLPGDMVMTCGDRCHVGHCRANLCM